MRTGALAVLLLSAALVWAAPLLGVLAAAWPALPYLKFPPRATPGVHASFTWPAFAMLSLPVIAFVALFIVACLRARPGPQLRRWRFPAWTCLGVALIAAGWTLAWSDALAPTARRQHMFTVLWLGYSGYLPFGVECALIMRLVAAVVGRNREANS